MGTKRYQDLDFRNVHRVLNLVDPSLAQHAATKAYVDAAIVGIRWKGVRARTTGNITISTGLNSGDVIDGVTLANGDDVLVDSQTTASEDGIYTVSASPLRSTVLPAGADARGLGVVIQEGTANGDKLCIQTAEPAIVGTNGLTFAALGTGAGGGFTVAGLGLADVGGGQIDVGDGGEGITINANDVALDFGTVMRWRTFTGPGSAGQTIVQAHGLGKTSLIVQVHETPDSGTTWRDITDGVIIDITTTNVTIDFGASQADRSIFRMVIGG